MNLVHFSVLIACLVNSVHLRSQPTWVYSGAPIGDTSIYKYGAGNLTSSDSMCLKHVFGQDSMRIKISGGNPVAFHIYRVDTFPNVNCGLPNMLNNNRYFGIFMIGSISPSYVMKYFYAPNPFVNAGNKPFLRVYERFNNASTACISWNDMFASQNFIGDTMSKPYMGSIQKEMILTYDNTILPVTIDLFNAEWDDENCNSSCVYWTVKSEQNCSHYEVERLVKGCNWEVVGRIDANTQSSPDKIYRVHDNNPLSLNYYRLKCIDKNGQFTYSKIINIVKDIKTISVSPPFPNPVNNNMSVTITSADPLYYEYAVIGSAGHVVRRGEGMSCGGSCDLIVPMQDLSEGPYEFMIYIPDYRQKPIYQTIIKKQL